MRTPFAPILALAVLATPMAATAAPLELSDQPYLYTVIDQDLRAVLEEFGDNLGLRVDIADGVRGRVHGRLPQLPPRGTLDHLAAQFDFDWYYDGHVLHVSVAEDSRSRLVTVEPVGFDALETSLRDLQVWDDRFVVRPHSEAGMAFVAGPPRFVAAVEDAATALIARARQAPPSATGVLTVYRGAGVSVLNLP